MFLFVSSSALSDIRAAAGTGLQYFREMPPLTASLPGTKDKMTLFVGQLAEVNIDALWEAFSVFGEVLSVSPIARTENGLRSSQ